jgi:hypothetical protein
LGGVVTQIFPSSFSFSSSQSKSRNSEDEQENENEDEEDLVTALAVLCRVGELRRRGL